MRSLKEICDKMAIEENGMFMKQFEIIPVEIKVEEKEDHDPRNWNKPSKAVVASDGMGNGCVLFHCGPHIDEEINAVGRQLSDLSLDDCPDGIWVWEGIYRGITHPSTPNGPEEYSTEVDGKFKNPNITEWCSIRANRCPWDKKEWLKDYKEEDMKEYGKFVYNQLPCKKCGSKEHSFCLTTEGLHVSTIGAFGEMQMTGDCVAQCLNCVWNGDKGYKCICGSPMMSMDSDRIRKEKENGEAGRRMKMKCSGCRAGLPLGSERYHYDKGDITVPCTHNPITGAPYSTGTIDIPSLPFPEIDIVVTRTDLNPRRKCDCGGAKCGLTHSDWCSTNDQA